MTDLSMRDIEERAAKCNICATELSIIENLLFGNRCIYCTTETRKISFWEFMNQCRLDYIIYTLTRKLIENHGEVARMLYLGCIAEAGAADIRGLRTGKDKCILIRIMKRYTKNGKEE